MRFRSLRVAALAANALLVALFAPSAAAGESRMALVVGNGDYAHAGRLANPPRDAALIAGTLRDLGFDVTLVTDAGGTALKEAMLAFGRRLRDSDAVGLFYYAGHGVQVAGRNYLVPVDAAIRDESEVGLAGISLDELLATMERAQARINIVVLDACRNNPFASAARSPARGLARADAPRGTFLAYATAPGSVALDGSGRHGPYAEALAGAMRREGLTLEQVFKEARRSVLETTGGQQTPWETSSLTGEFFFARPRATPVAVKGWTAVVAPATPRSGWDPVVRSGAGDLPKSPARQPQQPAARRTPVLAESSRRLVRPAEAAALDCTGLWIARHEILARRRFCFPAGPSRDYFGDVGCTTARLDALSALERSNLRILEEAGRVRACGPADSHAPLLAHR